MRRGAGAKPRLLSALRLRCPPAHRRGHHQPAAHARSLGQCQVAHCLPAFYASQREAPTKLAARPSEPSDIYRSPSVRRLTCGRTVGEMNTPTVRCDRPTKRPVNSGCRTSGRSGRCCRWLQWRRQAVQDLLAIGLFGAPGRVGYLLDGPRGRGVGGKVADGGDPVGQRLQPGHGICQRAASDSA